MANSRKKAQQKAKQKKRTKTSPFRLIVYILFIVISLLPIILPLIGTNAQAVHDFSVYNSDWNGCSMFHTAIEAEGYETSTLISNFNALNKLTTPGVLVILGPSVLRPFSPTDLIALLGFILQGGNVIIADDFGSANTLFAPINALLGPNAGITIGFSQGTLFDYGSYHVHPAVPIIRLLGPHPINDGVSSLMLNYASVINITVNDQSLSGLDLFALSSGEGQLFSSSDTSLDATFQDRGDVSPLQLGDLSSAIGLLGFSTPYSWVDLDDDGIPDPENETVGPFPIALAFDLAPFAPILGLNSSTPGKLALISDPSLFINEMWGEADNSVFAVNLINWMSNSNTTAPIIFDESHGEWPPTSAILYYGLVLGYVLSVAGIWFIAPLAPLTIILLVKRWLPKAQDIKDFKPTALFRRRSKTKFSSVMNQYQHYEEYSQPLTILYRKWKREFVSILRLDSWISVPDLLTEIKTRRPELNIKRLKRYLTYCENAKSTKKRINKNDFMNTFLGVKSILDALQGGEL